MSAPLKRMSIAVSRRCVRAVEPGRTFPVPLSQGYAVRVQCFDAVRRQSLPVAMDFAAASWRINHLDTRASVRSLGEPETPGW